MNNSFLLGKSLAYYEAAQMLALNLKFSITNLGFLYSKSANPTHTRVFLGLEPGPIVRGSVAEIRIIARFLAEHLVYDAILHKNTHAARIVHEVGRSSNDHNSDLTNLFLGLVNKFVVDLLDAQDCVNFVKSGLILNNGTNNITK